MPIGTPVLLRTASTNSTGVGSVVSSTLLASASAGDLVVVGLGYGLTSTPTTTITDSQGNTYTAAKVQDVTTSGAPHAHLYYSVLATGLTTGVDTITATFGSNVNYPFFAAYKTTGCATSSVLDQINGATGTGTAGDAGGVTTTQADEIIFVFGTVGVGAITGTVGTDYSELQDTALNSKSFYLEYKIVASTGTYAGDWTLSGSQQWAAAQASFKGGAASHSASVVLPLTAAITTSATASTPEDPVTDIPDATRAVMTYYYQ